MVLSTVYTLRKKEYLRGGRIRHVVPDGFIYPAPVDACGSWVLLIALFRLPPLLSFARSRAFCWPAHSSRSWLV